MRGIKAEFTTAHFERRAAEIVAGMTVDEISKTADEFIDTWPDWMPKFTAKRRYKVQMARNAIFGKLQRFEIS